MPLCNRRCALIVSAALVTPSCIIIGGDDDDDATASNSSPNSDSQPTAPGESESYGTYDDTGYDSGYGTNDTADTNDTSIEPTGADNDPESGCPCAPGTDLIYVLSDSGEIWSFDPEDLYFKRIAEVSCGGFSSTFSMGVSRKARAWIQYQHGDLYTVDLNDPGDPIDCLDPGFEHGHPKFPNFGMAFVANSVFDTCDKLHAHTAIGPDIIGPDVGSLGVIDPYSLELEEIAPIDYAWGELTGTSTGRLFAYQGSAPPLLNEYDKETGEYQVMPRNAPKRQAVEILIQFWDRFPA